ncbi:ABC transporter substrate-binding protein [Hydrogenoanaerobacterium sp.]|uniref:ABC transporter substrate-binding protein n=1 Tax=Hydrogenoanaerobacterium sp. TaxID=2953763 RepID=UPI00289E5FB5|nr:ABC transporter substrate-binding protein [Hydrogenoanaerobacterium sp.]
MKKIIALVLVAMMTATAFAGCASKPAESSSAPAGSSEASTGSSSDAASSAAATTVEEGKLIMVTEAGFAPYEYYDGQNVVGVDVDIAKEIAAAMGKELVVKDIAFDSIIPEINAGKADFGVAGMSITPERLETVDFTIEYATSKQVVVVKKDNTAIKTPEDIKGKKVAVQLGTVADIVVSEDYPDCTLIQQKKYLAAAEDVKSGKADCIVMDALPAEELVKENPELVILEQELFTDKYGMAVKKGNAALLEQINAVLQKLMDEGKIAEFTLNHTSK